MDSRDEVDNEQQASCGDSQSCSPGCVPTSNTPGCCGSGSELGGRSGRGSRLRLAAFIVVVAVAVVVAGFSLIRANKSAGELRGGIQYGEGLQPGDSDSSDGSAGYTIEDLAPNNDFALVLLAGADPEKMGRALQAVKETAGTLVGRGVNAAAFTVKLDDPYHKQMANNFHIPAFPAVVVMGKGCKPCVVTGDITGDGLLRTYVQTCGYGCGPSGCGAGTAKSGCCSGR